MLARTAALVGTLMMAPGEDPGRHYLTPERYEDCKRSIIMVGEGSKYLETIPWRYGYLWEARQDAIREGKPLLFVYTSCNNPLGYS